MFKKVIFKEMHWSWSSFVLVSVLIVAGLFIFDSIKRSQQTNFVTDSVTQYQDDIASSIFTKEVDELEPEHESQKEGNNQSNSQAISVPVRPKPKPKKKLTWCGRGQSSFGDRFGWSEWHVCKRRAEVGKPLPEDWSALAQTIIDLAKKEGYKISKTPSKYSILYRVYQGYIYHIGFVEKLNVDGSIEVSEMNHIGDNGQGGPGLVSKRTIPKDELSLNQYID